MTAAAMLLGIAAAGLLAEVLGIMPVIALQGGGYLLGGIIVAISLGGPAPGLAPLPQPRAG